MAPALVGLNVTDTTHVPPGATLAPEQSPVTLKTAASLPATSTPLMRSGKLPELVTVTDCALAAPTLLWALAVWLIV